MQDVESPIVPPWYRQFWPWYLLALPASAVIAGITTVFIATMNRDNLVVDNYYKAGLAINQTLSQQQLAQSMNLRANVHFDGATGKIKMELSGNQSIEEPTLKLILAHATLAEKDQTVMLTKVQANEYAGELKNFSSGKWHLILEPIDAQWRIETNISLPKQSWSLTPNV